MPAAKQYYPELNTVEARKLEEAFEAEFKSRQDASKEAWAYYDGAHRAPLRKDNTGTNDNLIINLIEGIIDKSVSSLIGIDDHGMVKGITFDIVDQPGEPGWIQRITQGAQRLFQQQGPSEEQQYLDEVWKANNAQMLMLDALLNGGVDGHSFLKVLARGEYTESGMEVPRVICLDPACVTVFWDAGDKSRVLWYRIQYEAGGVAYRQDIVREVDVNGADTGRWAIYNYRKERTSMFVADGEDVWDYKWPPIVDWKNLPNPKSYYGKSDIGGKGRLNDGLNLTASNVQRILKHHAHPKTVVTGARVEDILTTSIDSLWSIPSADAKVTNLEMQSDLSSSINFVMLLWRTIYDLARELNPGTVADKLGAITNFGLRVLFADSLAKGGIKRLLAGEALQRLNRYLLELGGYDVTLPINVVWPEPLPSDPLQTAQALQIMATLGLSNETALKRWGADPEQEMQLRQIKRSEAVQDQTAVGQGQQSLMVEAVGRLLRGGNQGQPQPPSNGGQAQ